MIKNTPLLDHIAIVLMGPKYAENIGSVARVMHNMGINDLRIVRETPPEAKRMAMMATHNATHILENMTSYTTLAEALSDRSIVVGTTARRGRQRNIERTPREIVETILPQIENNKVAILFGPEDRGLTNEDLKLCQYTSAIPTSGFSSLNLAQAVAIHCYEVYYSLIHAHKNMEPAPKLATSFELEGMYSHVEDALVEIDFLEEKNHQYWMNNIRVFFARIKLTAKDAQIIRGVCRQFLGHQKNNKK